LVILAFYGCHDGTIGIESLLKAYKMEFPSFTTVDV
jgi:hypothetical protein